MSDKLIASHNKQVLTALVNNTGTKISNSGFGELVKKSAGDDLLWECVASRKDIPEHHLRDLISKASDSAPSFSRRSASTSPLSI